MFDVFFRAQLRLNIKAQKFAMRLRIKGFVKTCNVFRNSAAKGHVSQFEVLTLSLFYCMKTSQSFCLNHLDGEDCSFLQIRLTKCHQQTCLIGFHFYKKQESR